ncbi:hypothetical protein M2447_000986 [Ereboglobus sp. PH5-10]|nr:hypothetical protein [Ereboglobus sp. PH5-10]
MYSASRKETTYGYLLKMFHLMVGFYMKRRRNSKTGSDRALLILRLSVFSIQVLPLDKWRV